MKKIIFAVLVIALNGCAPSVETQITAFHEMNDQISRSTFAIVPSDEQINSLEYKSYANIVKNELKNRRMVESSTNEARYGVHMKYGIDDGKMVTKLESTIGIVSYIKNVPVYGIVGEEPTMNEVFTRFLNVTIVDNSKYNNGIEYKVYEGKALSKGSSKQLGQVMPPMIRSLFEEFPGKSGVPRVSEQPIEK